MSLKNGLMLNALPDESASSPEVQACLALADKLGLEVSTLRVSGHANALALKTLIEAVKPTTLIPLVPQTAAWFAAEHPELAVVTQDNIEC